MISVVALLCLVAPAAFGEFTPRPGLRMLQQEERGVSYLGFPTRREDAVKSNWEKAELPSNIPEKFADCVEMYVHPDEVFVGLLFNTEGYLMGINMGFDQEYLSNTVSDMPYIGYSNYSMESYNKQRNYWSSPIFFTCDPNSVSSWDSNKIVQGGKICVLGFDGQLTEISTKMSENTDFTRQKCLNGGGIHHFYNLTSSMECTKDNLFPYYLYADCDGNMIGMGSWIFADYFLKEKHSLTVSWGAEDLSLAMVDYPKCIADLASTPGIPSYEFWIVDNPQEFSCK